MILTKNNNHTTYNFLCGRESVVGRWSSDTLTFDQKACLIWILNGQNLAKLTYT